MLVPGFIIPSSTKDPKGILGSESCNGWTYWHCNVNGVSVPIDNLRQKLIANN